MKKKMPFLKMLLLCFFLLSGSLFADEFKETSTIKKVRLDVPQYVQTGPTCGLYALKMVSAYFAKKSSLKTMDIDLLLRYGVKNGFTKEGELFDTEFVGLIANAFGMRANVVHDFTVNDIIKALNAKHPVILPFDVNNLGNPGCQNGAKAHYTVITGYEFEKRTNKLKFYARHGWWDQLYLWKAEDLMKSHHCLNESPYYLNKKTPKMLGAPRLLNGNIDISKTLQTKMVELSF